MVLSGRNLLRVLGLTLAIVSAVSVCAAQTSQNALIGLFLGYSKAINTVALSPDGRQALTGGQDNMLRLWDLPTGLLLRTFDTGANRINAAAFSPDGKQLLSGGADKLVRLWNLASGLPIATMEGHTGEVLAVAFSPDGRRVLSASADHTAKLWDAETGALLKTFEGHSSDVLSAAFSPDGKTMLSASADKTLKLWDVETGALLKTLEGHTDAVTSAAFSPDGGQALSASRDKTIKLWDLASGQAHRSFEGHSDEVLSAHLSSDGSRIISAAKDKTLKLWDTKTGDLIATFEGHSGAVTSVAFSPDGQSVLSGSLDETLKLWNLVSGKLQTTIDLASPNFWPNGYRDFFSGVALGKSASRAEIEQRLKDKGMKLGSPVFLRIFKGDREAELWMKRGERYALFGAYPICAWSGQLGPKEREGDLQAPEGFYTIGKDQLNPNSRYHRAFNLGYPNEFDRAHNRTGANLMIHGACASVGCFAMTDGQIDELWLLVTAALDGGQERVPVHVFPFRMTSERMAAFAWHPWAQFWRDMKPAYDLFEDTRIPPRIAISNKRYSVEGQSRGGWLPVSRPMAGSGGGRSLLDETGAANRTGWPGQARP